jgi:cardiolipin synthase (CMP-forming)
MSGLPSGRGGRIFTVPNQLTFLRLTFLPFFIIAIRYERYGWALGILVAAGLSDGLDGLLARVLDQKTPLGAYLDPIADKLLLSTSFFVLALEKKIGWWLAIMVLGRDVLILTACAAIIVTMGYRPFPPSIFGKAATFCEILLVVLVLLAAAEHSASLALAAHWVSYLVACLVVFTGLHYSIVVSRQLHTE